jgi:UDP-3-O-acyl-N-acetylglucosamine deacetylase
MQGKPKVPRAAPRHVGERCTPAAATHAESIKTTGVGLHTGARGPETPRRSRAADTSVSLPPRRSPVPPTAIADGRHVGDTRLSSTLKRDGASVSTVSTSSPRSPGSADNLHVDVAGPKSRSWITRGPFVFLLQSAGIVRRTP